MIVYHGTNAQFDTFRSEYTGKGNDQLGSGFYFTDNPDHAKQYGDIVLKCEINITNPLIINEHNLNNVKLTEDEAFKFIKQSPDLYDREETPLWNFVDITDLEINDEMLRDVASTYEGSPLLNMENDFFKDKSTAFRTACQDILGYDGIVSHQKDSTVYVCWFPEQIEIIDQIYESIVVQIQI